MNIYTEESQLNPQQLEAVTHGDGPLLIIAGAGTGKTTVVTERIKWLISQGKAQPSEILALTFTDKAAREMEDRVDRAMPYGYTQMWMTTFHAFGERILRSEAVQIGLDPGYRLMTRAEAIMLFRKHLFSFDLEYYRPLGNPRKFIEGILTHFDRLKDEDISPEDYIQWAEKGLVGVEEEEAIENQNKFLELSHAYQVYEELKIKHGVMDFSDLISNTLKLFRTRKNVLQMFQEQFKYILIDEFQDTNFAQNQLAKLLAGTKQNINVVGDDDQAIYRWRGAAVSNIIQFREQYPKASIVVLTQNYRSTAEILDKSYRMIQHNNPDRLEIKEQIDKKLIAGRKKNGEEIEFIYTQRVDEEADEVVTRIKQVKNKKNSELSWNDIAILVRANSHADAFIRALSRAGIPFQFLGPGMLFRQPEVRDLIAYLKLLCNLEDSIAAYCVFSMTIFDIQPRDLLTINSFAKKIGTSFFGAADMIVAHYTGTIDHWSQNKNYDAHLPTLADSTIQKLTDLVNMVMRHIGFMQRETAGQILFYFLEDSGLLKRLTAEITSSQQEKEILNVTKFFDKLKEFENQHEDASVQAVIEWIDMAMELGESPLATEVDWSTFDGVNILTIHASKGLEFPVVFVVNLVNGRFPSTSRREQIPIPDALVKEILPEGDYHLQEERRLFYVAMTRARDQLFLSASTFYGEGKMKRKVSPFVSEALGESAIQMTQTIKATTQQLTLLEWKKEEVVQTPVARTPVTYLSYSQIDTFLTCPLQYKYRYILKIPAPAAAAASFGTTMHAALQKFYEKVKAGEKPRKEHLLELLETYWVPVGYGTKEYEQKMKQRGIDMLNAFFEESYDEAVIPHSLEQVFKIRLTPMLAIGGKIDRVDAKSDGSIEIIDYKTGKKQNQKEINENLQMTVYALAATDKGIFDKKPEQVMLTFYFFDAHERVSTVRTVEQLEKSKEILLNIANDISTSEFAPKPGPWCDFCDFRLLCSAWK